MQVVEGFWAGAVRHGAHVDVVSLAERAGGWAALEACTARELVALGVPEDRASDWLTGPPVRSRGSLVRACDEAYPPRLLELGPPGLSERGCPPPPVLFVEGAVEVLSRPAVAIVGTRRCTPHGATLARRLSLAAVRAGHVVVSGLARGIDGHAHRAALQGGATVAVVGHGLGQTSPASHRALRRAIVDEGGAILSTWPDDVRAAKHTFPRRNRWIAALALHVLVVEAPRRSGALITAEFADAIGRRVWAAPGPIGATESEGCLALVENDQATVLPSVRAWTAALGGLRGRSTPGGWLRQVFGGADLADVARQRGISHTELLAELARLEVEGEVVRLPGRRYAPAGGPG